MTVEPPPATVKSSLEVYNGFTAYDAEHRQSSVDARANQRQRVLQSRRGVRHILRLGFQRLLLRIQPEHRRNNVEIHEQSVQHRSPQLEMKTSTRESTTSSPTPRVAGNKVYFPTLGPRRYRTPLPAGWKSADGTMWNPYNYTVLDKQDK